MGRSRSPQRDRRPRSRDRGGDRGDRDAPAPRDRGGDRGDRGGDRADRGGDRGDRDAPAPRDRGGDRGGDRGDRGGDRGDRDAPAPRDREKRSRSRGRRDEPKSRTEDKPKPKEEECELKPGRRVVVHGLQKNPEKNGAIGILGEFNKEKERWAVEFSSGSSNNFKAENLDVMQEMVDDDPNEEIPTSKIYITNISADVTVPDLITLFGGIGVIAKEPQRSSKGGSKGFQDQWPPAVKLYKPGRSGGDGCVEFTDKVAAKAAIKTYTGYRLKGSKINIQYAGQGMKYEQRELTLPWAQREENADKIRMD